MKLHRFAALLAALILLIPRPGARAATTRSFFAMNTALTMTVETADKGLLDRCEAEFNRLEGLMSVTLPDSEISRLNAYGSATLSRDTLRALETALDVAERTDGALDVTLYPVTRAWGFTSGSHRVPGKRELFLLQRSVGWRRIGLDGFNVSVPEGMMVDLSAVAKGYVVDKLEQLLLKGGETNALLDLGGHVRCLGGKSDGSAWRVGIRDPEDSSALAGILSVQDCAVVTSGLYERSFTAGDGTVYGHIFDPVTCCPARSGLISASVVGESAAMCDGLSTALIVLGTERACELLRGLEGFDAILIDENHRLYVTVGLKDRFAAQGTYGEANIRWIERTAGDGQ